MDPLAPALAWARACLGSGALEDDAWGRRRGERGGYVLRLVDEELGTAHALKIHGPGRAYPQAKRAGVVWGVGRFGLAVPTRAWNDELGAALTPWAAARSPGSFDNSAFREVGILLGRLHALAVEPCDEMPLSIAFERRLGVLMRELGARLEPAIVALVEARGSSWARAWDGKRVASHRDPRPENLVLWEGGLRLIDFEHAREDSWAMDLAAAGASFGAEAYAALWSGYQSANTGDRGSAEDESLALEGAGVLRALQTLCWEGRREERVEAARIELRVISGSAAHEDSAGSGAPQYQLW